MVKAVKVGDLLLTKVDLHGGVKQVILTSQVNQLQAISIAAWPLSLFASILLLPTDRPFLPPELHC